jgi:hypothetical protein
LAYKVSSANVPDGYEVELDTGHFTYCGDVPVPVIGEGGLGGVPA